MKDYYFSDVYEDYIGGSDGVFSDSGDGGYSVDDSMMVVKDCKLMEVMECSVSVVVISCLQNSYSFLLCEGSTLCHICSTRS